MCTNQGACTSESTFAKPLVRARASKVQLLRPRREYEVGRTWKSSNHEERSAFTIAMHSYHYPAVQTVLVRYIHVLSTCICRVQPSPNVTPCMQSREYAYTHLICFHRGYLSPDDAGRFASAWSRFGHKILCVLAVYRVLQKYVVIR
jgi:hypothetical protein